MGQTGFFDLERRLDALSSKGDPLETIKTTVPWEDFRADIEAVTETKPEERKSNAEQAIQRDDRTPTTPIPRASSHSDTTAALAGAKH